MTRIMLSYIHFPVSSSKYFKATLRRMGYEVVSVGPDRKGALPWAPAQDFSEYADPPTFTLVPEFGFALPVEKALEKTGPVDLIIQMDANFHLTGKAPVPNVVWMIDNHVAPYTESVQDADLLFGAHSWGYQHEDKRFKWLPCAYSPVDHFQDGHPRKLDLIFVGVLYPHRVKLLEKLADICPNGVGVGMGVLGKEYNDANNGARIGLCLSACGDVPMRVFENAAQGLCVFCDLQRDLPKLGLKDGVHYIGFGSTDEAVNKFKAMLNTPQMVQDIAMAGKEALKGETYEARVQAILDSI